MNAATIAITLSLLAASGFALPSLVGDEGLPGAVGSQAEAAGDAVWVDDYAQDERADADEDSSTAAAQHDGGKPGDAPGTCEEVDEERELAPDGNTTSGVLVQDDDESDVFFSPIAPEYLGERLQFELIPGQGADVYELGFDILHAECGYSVLDPDAEIYEDDGREAPPTTPVEAGDGETLHEYSTGSGYDCNSGEWKFMLKHFGKKSGLAQPGSIYVEWSNGDWEYVDLHATSSHQVAKYLTRYNVDHTVTSIQVAVDEDWSGSFKVAHGPCSLEEGSGFQDEPDLPDSNAQGASFTVSDDAGYVIHIWIEKDAVENLEDGPSVREIKIPLNKDCHERYCSALISEIGFELNLFKDTDNLA